MSQIVFYSCRNISVGTTGNVDCFEVTAPAGDDLIVNSIYMLAQPGASTDPAVSYEVHAASARTAGTTVAGVKQDQRGSQAVQSSGSSLPTAITDLGEQDGAMMPVGAPFYQLYAGNLVIKAGQSQFYRINRNGGTGTVNATIKVGVIE